jgi:hypothetical protein
MLHDIVTLHNHRCENPKPYEMESDCGKYQQELQDVKRNRKQFCSGKSLRATP